MAVTPIWGMVGSETDCDNCWPNICCNIPRSDLTMTMSEHGTFTCPCDQPSFPWACDPWSGSAEYSVIDGCAVWIWHGSDPYFSSGDCRPICSGTAPDFRYVVYSRIAMYCKNGHLGIFRSWHDTDGEAESGVNGCWNCDSGGCTGSLFECPAPFTGQNCGIFSFSLGSHSCSPWSMSWTTSTGSVITFSE
jgi:hypothetical protein